MSTPPSTGHRVVALVIAVVLIGGGVAGISTAHDHAITVVSSAVAIIAGLLFLRRAASRARPD